MSEPTLARPLLGDFIRAHRERLAPESVGLPRGPRRRAQGLRREELASLCGISVTWLTWIEQGRAVSLSSATLGALADALMLTAAERSYLFDLAALRDREHPAAASAAAARETRTALAASVAAFKCAAYALDRAWNAVEWNRPAAALLPDWLGRKATERNLLNYTFLDPRARQVIDDWPGRARRLVAEFRADLGTGLKTGTAAAQVDALRALSPDFDSLWRQQDVLEREGGERVFNHPTRGRVTHRQVTLKLAHAPDWKLVLLL